MSHPINPNPSEEELLAWANCSVPDCENKVTHDSDKCYPHTYGWEPVKRNLRRRIFDARMRGDDSVADTLSEALERIKFA